VSYVLLLFGLRHGYPAVIFGVCTESGTSNGFVYGFFMSVPQRHRGLLPFAGWMNAVTSLKQSRFGHR